MIIYLAGLQSVPTDMYDAAKVDGANILRRFFNITLPLMSPVIFYNLVIGLIATFQYFTQAYIASTSVGREVGGPVRSTLFTIFTFIKVDLSSSRWDMPPPWHGCSSS